MPRPNTDVRAHEQRGGVADERIASYPLSMHRIACAFALFAAACTTTNIYYASPDASSSDASSDAGSDARDAVADVPAVVDAAPEAAPLGCYQPPPQSTCTDVIGPDAAACGPPDAGFFFACVGNNQWQATNCQGKCPPCICLDGGS